MTAEEYFASFSPEDQAAIKASWGGKDMLAEWFKNAQAAGAVPGGAGEAGGGGGASYGPGWTPSSKADLVAYAKSHGWSEDFARFDEGTVMSWIKNNWDPQAGAFTTEKTTPGGEKITGYVEKPVDTPEGWYAWGQYAKKYEDGDGGGGPGGPGVGPGGAGPGAGTGYGGAPLLDLPEFKAPTYEEAISDPGYQFALKEGQGAIERSAAAKGTLRSGGTLKDLMDYGQGSAAQQYGTVFDRAVTKYGLDTGAAASEFAPLYGSWQTQYGGDLSKWTTKFGGDLQKYLQKEQNLYGLLSAPPPVYGG
jgi:hypothetical protein